MTRKPGEPLFIRGLDHWITREDYDDLPEAVAHAYASAEPTEEQMLLDMLWDRINSLGGADPARSAKPYAAGRTTGFNEAIDACLAILEEAGARPPNKRETT